MKILPIGTLIKKQDHRLMVVGYKKNIDEKTGYLEYILIPHPLGYISSKSLFCIPQNADFEVCYMGYVTDEYQQRANNLISFVETLQEVGNDKWKETVDRIYELIESEVSNNG